LVFALVVLCIFYAGYTIGSAFHDNDSKDEYFITHNCTCKPSHRDFYISWFIICITLWAICHFLILLFTYIKKCFCSTKERSKVSENRNNSGNQNTNPNNEQSNGDNEQSDNHNINSNIRQLPVDDKNQSNGQSGNENNSNDGCCCGGEDNELNRYENYLWTQYYELYTIGITKDVKIFNKQNVKNIFEYHINGTDFIDGPQSKDKEKSTPDIVAVCTDYSTSSWIFYIIHCGFHVFFCIIRFVAQLATIPLLIIQLFDTYAFLCFSAGTGDYCTRRGKYKLHLDQTAITFGFYCSLTVSYLITIMLRWFPWPKEKPNSSPKKTNRTNALHSFYPGHGIFKRSFKPNSNS